MIRIVLIVCAVSLAPVFAGQAPAAPSPSTQQPAAGRSQAETPPPAPTAPMESDAREVREQLQQVLQRYPPEVGRILKMDPTMLQNPTYLSQYPALASFLATHPQVSHNPGYYLEFVRPSYDYNDPELLDPKRQVISMWRNVVQSLTVFVFMVFVASVLAWLVHTVLNHRRWQRISKVQTEVHNKLLDRFAGTDELLAYVQTPAGRRFLEAAPIPLDDSGTQSFASPIGRILWSVQIGIVLAVGGLGFQFISGRVLPEVAEGLWVIGVLAVAFGVGFIVSAAASYVLSRRLGMLDPRVPLVTSDRGD
jgi:hypothetical protein